MLLASRMLPSKRQLTPAPSSHPPMRCSDAMRRRLVVVGAERSVLEAAKMMRERGCGVLPVVDADRRVLGILTDRDIVLRACVTGRRRREECCNLRALLEYCARSVTPRCLGATGPVAGMAPRQGGRAGCCPATGTNRTKSRGETHETCTDTCGRLGLLFVQSAGRELFDSAIPRLASLHRRRRGAAAASPTAGARGSRPQAARVATEVGAEGGLGSICPTASPNTRHPRTCSEDPCLSREE